MTIPPPVIGIQNEVQHLAPNVTRPPQPSADPHSCRNPDSHVRSAGPAPFRTYSPRVRWYSMPARVWVRGCWSLLVGHRGRHGPHAVFGVTCATTGVGV